VASIGGDFLVAFGDLLEVVGGQRMCQSIIGRGECLIEAALLIAPQLIKQGVDMGLPIIDRLILPKRLRQRVGIL